MQENWVDWPDPLNDRVGNIMLSRIMGADVRLDPAGFGIGIKSSWQQALDDVTAAGGKPYPIPAGASEHPLGGLGFAGWADEVAQQEAELGVFFDTIVVCTVTGSTHAGMIAGFAGQHRPRRVLGIDASATLAETRDQVARIARNTASLIGLDRDLRDDEITVLEGWAGEKYGIPVDSTLDAIRLTGRLEGVILDPVYEGKSMAGLIDLVTSGEIGQRQHRSLRPPRRPAGPERLQRAVPLTERRRDRHLVRSEFERRRAGDDQSGALPRTLGGEELQFFVHPLVPERDGRAASPLSPPAMSRSMPRSSASTKSDCTQSETSSTSVSARWLAPTPSITISCWPAGMSMLPVRPWSGQAGGWKCTD